MDEQNLVSAPSGIAPSGKLNATRRYLLALGVALGASSVRAAEPRDLAGAIITAAGKQVTDGLSMGVAVGVGQTGRPASLAAAGSANVELNAPTRPDTSFRIASCTKQFTAAAIMMLAEQGKLSPQDRLSRFFPDFPKADEVTLHHLLTHTSGLHDYVRGGLPADAGANWQADPDRHKFLARMQSPYDFAPGVMWAYSNSGYALLGEIIEKVSGLGYGAFLATNVLGPAGMIATAIDRSADIVPGRASGYRLEAGKPHDFRNAEISGLPIAEGGLRSTVGDLMRWNQRLFAGQVVSSASLAQMVRPATVNSGAPSGSARFIPPGITPGKPPAYVERSDYGYGLEVSQMFGQRVVWHSGGIAGFNSLLMRFMDLGVDVALLSNTENGAVGAFEPILRIAAGRPGTLAS